MRQFPWVSFLILLLACANFGWILSSYTSTNAQFMFGWIKNLNSELLTWMIAGSLLLLMDMGLTAPVTLIEVFFGSWLTSDKRAFLTVLVLAFGVAVALTWIYLFGRILVLLAAGTLFRLDLQRAKFKRWQALTILLFTCMIGYAIGILSHESFG
ncbi:MAG: hypothetical protein BRC33_13080 [Cyanobacteria bacterium SW_9_44_58]|nr:MAG: hypothetical protein BRC33_13080 [Cyanobacteria bacterium SW_9_44_58]